MNREGAETYLRLLAEAELRDPSVPLTAVAWYSGLPAGSACRKLQVVAQALTAVDALEQRTADAILADFDLAVSVRQPRHAPGPAVQAGFTRVRARPMRKSLPPNPFTLHTPQVPAWSGPERFVPLGLTIPLRFEGTKGGLYLMSYAHTASGARFTVAWQPYDRLIPNVPAVGLCTVTDDRGGRYQLNFSGTSSGPEWTGVAALHPDPPGDLRWLDIRPPDAAAIRVALDAAPDTAAARLTTAEVDPGEHLLTLGAERLLTSALLFPHDIWRDLPATSPGPLADMATGLGEVVAALGAAGLLAPGSLLPGRLATLCANLRIDVSLAAPPVRDLPEPWLSLLAQLHRRKPDAAPHRDGVAALAAALPELDGIRLAFLGLNNAEKSTFLHALASGLTAGSRPGPFGIEMYFPLSLWLRDSGGRWHLARPDGRTSTDGEDMLRLRLAPPLPRSAGWVEVLAAGRSAQARVRVPLRWEDRP